MTAAGEGRRAGVRAALRRLPSRRPAAEELAADRARALELTPVSRETMARLDRFVALLLDWQQRVNLIAPSTERTLWTRHVADSLQLLSLASHAQVWADFGSGAGFPGLVLACALAKSPDACVHLVESNGRKATFLREAVRETGAPAAVHALNAAGFLKSPPSGIAAVTARALAPLPDLLTLAYPLLIKGAIGLFPKGQGVEAELTEAAQWWNVEATLIPSRTDANARIVVVKGLKPRPRSRSTKR